MRKRLLVQHCEAGDGPLLHFHAVQGKVKAIIAIRRTCHKLHIPTLINALASRKWETYLSRIKSRFSIGTGPSFIFYFLWALNLKPCLALEHICLPLVDLFLSEDSTFQTHGKPPDIN